MTIYVVCAVFLLAIAFFAIDRGTGKNIIKLMLFLLGLVVFAAFLIFKLVDKLH